MSEINPVLDKNSQKHNVYFDDIQKLLFSYVDGIPREIEVAIGPKGDAATIKVGNTYPVEQDEARVENIGDEHNAVLEFYMPKGDVGPQGVKGDRATIQIGQVTSGTVPNVTNVGDEHDAIFDFVLAKGDKGDKGDDALAAIVPKGNWAPDTFYSISDYVTAEDGNAYVCMKSHTSSDDNMPPNAELWQLIALRGANGKAATIQIGQVLLGARPNVVNVGDEHNAVLDFTLTGTEISKEAGNIIEEKADGIYAKADEIVISQQDNNITELKDDGLFSTVKISKDTEFFKLTKENGDEISTTPLNYLSLERLDEYIYKVTFNDIKELNENIDVAVGNCSSIISKNKLYRNFDFKYNEDATFIVKTEKFTGTAYIPNLTKNNLTDDLISQLPYHLSDGINNHGIMVAAHLVYNDFNWNGNGDYPIWAVPTKLLNELEDLDETKIQEILDNAKNDAKLNKYAIQFLISNGTKTLVAEPRNNYVIKDISSKPMLTNFFWQENDVREDVDAYKYIENGNRPNGVERFRLLKNVDLQAVKFTNTYNMDNKWLSETIGLDNTTKLATVDKLEQLLSDAIDLYNIRTRDGQTWQTVHSVIYDSAKGMEHLWVQEDYNKDYIASSGGGEGTKIPIQPEEPDNTDVWIDNDEDAFLTTEAFESVPVGSIIPLSEDRYLYGYLKCDGSEYNVNDYPDLFGVIKYKYGGQNDKFKVPDLRELVLVGSGHNDTQNIAVHDEYDIGQFKDDQIQTHQHQYTGTQSYSAKDGTASTNNSWSGYTNAFTYSITGGRSGDTTHGKQIGVAYFIKAIKTYNISLNVDGQDAEPIIKQKVDDEFDKRNTYSTDETVIGKWIDGKPIYRRYIPLNNIQITTSWTDTNIVINDFDKLTNNTVYRLNSTQTAVCFVEIIYSTKHLRLQSLNANITNVNGILLEYTKTTD